jgi:mannosyl-3-phosphoglycerate phosphatase family protein
MFKYAMNSEEIIIFTDLDGSLLNHDNFEFKKIKDFILECLLIGIKIIPNSSKTKKEIEIFSSQLGMKLPYIVENGAAIHNLDVLNPAFKIENNSLVLSRTIEEILEIFNKEVPKNFKEKCSFLKDMDKKQQQQILGLSEQFLPFALDRDYSIPFIFNGSHHLIDEFRLILETLEMKLHEGGRVFNISDNCSKGSALKSLIDKLKKDFLLNPFIIVVGDSPNDISMLKEAHQPCVVPLPNKNNLDNLEIKNILRAKQCAPEGWEEVIRSSLKRLNINLAG